MYKIFFKPTFVKQAKKLESEQYDLLKDKIELLKQQKSHKSLKVHKLHGVFSNCYSFSLNYHTRVIFKFVSNQEIVLLSVGGHDMYKG